MATLDNICIPMHLDAFALSPDCCDESLKSKIAPFTQPNYTALRLDSHLIQHDVLDHVDFHTSSPATKNPRLADIGIPPPNNLKPNRMGIHLHWSLPRLYRTAAASGRKQATGENDPHDPTQPVFRQIPTRWLVVRHLRNFQEQNVLPKYQSWVVESDAVRKIKTIPDDVDLESEVSPFVSYEGDSADLGVLKAQTEVFIGQKFPLPWHEDTTRKHLTGGLTVLTSSNPLFPDYALHNANSLSIIDNFAYKRNPTDQDFSYLEKATCDYFVIGWHADGKDDPLATIPADAIRTDQKYLNSRLDNLLLKLTTSASTSVGTSQAVTRCLVHGAIYKVEYNYRQRPRSLAEESAVKFTSNVKMEPLAIGSTPLDAILTFLEAHKDNSEAFFGPGTNAVAEDILQLAQLLYASADEYDARVQAQDLLRQQNYAKVDGGSRWTYAKGADPTDASKPQSGKPKIPSEAEVTLLNQINEFQTRLDTCTRKLKSLRWDLFAEWWKYTSEFIPDKEPEKSTRQNEYRREVDRIKDLIAGKDQGIGLIRETKELQSQIARIQTTDKLECKISANEAYRIRIDPVICIAGLANGWPSDVMEKLEVKLSSELNDNSSGVASIFGPNPNPIPTDHALNDTGVKILAACLNKSNTGNGLTLAPKIEGFQAWGGKNPFIPLFIEWESMYYHIDFDKWDIQVRSSPFGHPHPQVRYAPKSSLNVASNQKDFRTLSGRINVLAQPLLNLEDIVLEVLDSRSPDITLTDEEILAIRNTIKQFQFVAAPLAGLTNHLLTRCEGAHVKPNVRVQGQKVVPLEAAVQSSSDIHIDLDTLGLVDAESALTPYGDLFAFAADQYPKPPFKGVTHGQMLFTRLHIIDKFGQAICVPVPRPRRRKEVHPPDSKIYPCLSDELAPDVVNNIINTVFPTPDPVQPGQWPLCQYVQLAPSINQPARLNAAYLIRDTNSDGSFSPWREATDYEQPIWGWVIINYADSGLQFFQADGTFYTEIRKGGVHGSHVSPKWLPYGVPEKDPTDAAHAQLSDLIEQLSPPVDSDNFLQAFINMINGSIQNMPFPPSSYSAFANAIVGKPLALVNVGWSLELAEPAYRPQNSLGKVTSNPQADLESYEFKLKIGDEERNFDGLAGYFQANNTATDSSTKWDKLYTYFVPEPHSKVRKLIPDEFLRLKPYYINPENQITPNFAVAKARKYQVTSVLLDPYTAIHGYSPALPTKSLQLPLWTVQAAFEKMHAFFHVGPSLVINDVPSTYEKATVPAPPPPTPVPGPTPPGTVPDPFPGQLQPPSNAVRLPVGGKTGTWTWLQPYPPATDEQGNEVGQDPRYAELPVQEDLGNVRYAPGPYTFVEGFLQLMGKLGRDVGTN